MKIIIIIILCCYVVRAQLIRPVNTTEMIELNGIG